MKLSTHMDELVRTLEESADLGHEDAGRQKGAVSPFFLEELSHRAGLAYEKFRSALDNKEEQFLRHHSIRRILKRATIFHSDPKTITVLLARDLYRGGYLKERELSEQMHARLLAAVTNFLALSDAVAESVGAGIYSNYRRDLLDIGAGTLEHTLYPVRYEEAVVVTCARMAEEDIVSEWYRALPEMMRRRQLYLASWRAMFAADSSLLFYKLWLLEVPGWGETISREKMSALGASFPARVRKLHHELSREIGHRLVPRLHHHAVAATLLYNLVKRYGAGIGSVAANPRAFEQEAENIIHDRYLADLRRARARSWRAILYIFLTKAVLAVLVESYSIIFFRMSPNFIAIGVNIIFHPALLFFLTSGMRKPNEDNTRRILLLLHAMVYGGTRRAIELPRKSGGIIRDFAFGAYVVALFAVMGSLVVMLQNFGFLGIDITFFVLFLTLILYFGFRISYSARWMLVAPEREGFIRSFLELLVLPIVSVGRFITVKFDRINFIVFFLDFFVEAPFKMVLEFFDSFGAVIREKKEEIYS